MKINKVAIILFASFIFTVPIVNPSQVTNFYFSGAELHSACNALARIGMKSELPGDIVYGNQCQGFIVGVHDSEPYLYCPPSGVTINQLVAIVTKYLNDNPESWHFMAASLVRVALVNAFPCPK